MTSRDCDIQYNLIVSLANFKSNQIVQKDTGSILKMLPYFHAAVDDNTIYADPKLLVIEITGQEPPTIDNVDIKYITSVYKKRKELGLRTVVVLSYTTENTIFRDQFYLVLSIINNGVDAKNFLVFFPNGNALNDHMIEVRSSIENVGCKIISVCHAELHAFYRTQVTFEQDVSSYSSHRPKKILLPLGKAFKPFRLESLYNIFTSGRIDDFQLSIFEPADDIQRKFSVLNSWYPDISKGVDSLDFLGVLDFSNYPNLLNYVKDKSFVDFCLSKQGDIEDYHDVSVDYNLILSNKHRRAHLGYPFSKKSYDNSKLSFVLETHFKGDFVTEKFFKPIINSQPFVLCVDESYRSFVTSLGYQLFDDLTNLKAGNTPEYETVALRLKQTFLLLDNYDKIESSIIEKVNHNLSVFKTRSINKLKEIQSAFISYSIGS